MKRRPLDEIDCELILLRERRLQATDLLWRCLTELDAVSARVDVLLDRRHAQSAAPMIHR